MFKNSPRLRVRTRSLPNGGGTVHVSMITPCDRLSTHSLGYTGAVGWQTFWAPHSDTTATWGVSV